MEEYIQPFIDVSTSVFKDFLQVDLTTERIFFVEKDDFHDWDISGIIGLTGEASGAVAVSMKTETALKITGLLTGETHTKIDDEVTDAVGEIINIIAGNVKKYLEEMFKLVISLPTIIRGKDHVVVWPSEKTRVVCIPFSIFTNETVCLSVAISKLEK
ncbi:MAG: chemotaxis protein CheX [Treponema sp.]|jgi:chemotaxis protein CheX|nr:chemotaxis protein CheX [Treponema sp.]